MNNKNHEQARRINSLNFPKFNFYSKNKHGIPELLQQDIQNRIAPENFISFNELLQTKDFKNKGVHFFIDDYRFERIWNAPDRYLPLLKQCSLVLTPDFSVYTDMPEALQIYNIYRSRVIGRWLQENGINVVPTLQWAGENTFDYAFEGIPQGSPVAVGTMGALNTALFDRGYMAVVEVIKPSLVYAYGNHSSIIPDDTIVIPPFFRRFENGR